MRVTRLSLGNRRLLLEQYLGLEVLKGNRSEENLAVTKICFLFRLTRVIGKSKAMEMCLTGNMINAEEAEKAGLVSKIFPAEKLVEEAIKLGEKISSHSPLIVQLCKEAVNTAYETTLHEGLKFERRTFHATFSTVNIYAKNLTEFNIF